MEPSPEWDCELELSSLHVVHEADDSVGFLQGMGCTDEDVRDCVKEDCEELRDGDECALAVGVVSEDSFHRPRLFSMNLRGKRIFVCTSSGLRKHID